MKKGLLLCCSVFVFAFAARSQETGSANVKPASLGLHFILNDFVTASRIRATSLNTVLREKTRAKIKEMSPGLALSYMKGLSPQVDFSSTLGASFVDYPFDNGTPLAGNSSILLELDASLHAKMLPDNYWVNPFLSAGIAASKYKGYYGALIPVGVGLQINLFNEAFLIAQSQYRIKVTDNTNFHFYGSIGFVGPIVARNR